MNANKLFVIIGILLVGMLVVVPVSADAPATFAAHFNQSDSGETFGAYGNPTGNPLGGGVGYSDIINAGDPRITNTSTNIDQFLAALSAATSGDVIYIPEDAEINMTGHYGNVTTIPAGVTIASNRGQDGSSGGLIFQNRIPGDPTSDQLTSYNAAMLRTGGDNVRITGLRIEGSDKTNASMKYDFGFGMKYGILNQGHYNLTVNNNEIWGWSWAGVAVRNETVPNGNATIYHNYIHHCQDWNVGYGVANTGGDISVLGNVFDYTKHAVSNTGYNGENAEISYNIYLTHSTSQVFDVHEGDTGSYGDTYWIHHNTVLTSTDFAVHIRQVPNGWVRIENNVFQDNTHYGSHDPAVAQSNGVFGNMTMTHNMVNGVYYNDGVIWELTW